MPFSRACGTHKAQHKHNTTHNTHTQVGTVFIPGIERRHTMKTRAESTVLCTEQDKEHTIMLGNFSVLAGIVADGQLFLLLFSPFFLLFIFIFSSFFSLSSFALCVLCVCFIKNRTHKREGEEGRESCTQYRAQYIGRHSQCQ